MANLLKWFDDRRKNVQNVGSKAFDTVNPLDSGRSWTTRTPTEFKSISQNLGDIKRNFVDPVTTQASRAAFSVGQSPVGEFLGIPNQQRLNEKLSSDIRRTLGPDAALAFDTAASQRTLDQYGVNANDSALRAATKVAGNIYGTAANFIPVASGAQIAKAPIRQIPRLVNNAGLAGAASNVLSTVSEDGATLRDALQAGITGYSMGAAIPVAGATVRGIAKVAPPAVGAVTKVGKKFDEIAFTPRTTRLNLEAQDALKAYSDRLVGADPNIRGRVESDLISRVRQIGQQNGVDLTNGTIKQQMDKIENLLSNRQVNQGGYVRVPGSDPMQSTWDANPFNSRNLDEGSATYPQGTPARIGEVLGQSPLSKTPKGTTLTQGSSSLPLYNTKKTSTLDKVFRSTRGVIERQGDDGKQLAELLRKARDTEELYQADVLSRLKTVRGLKGKAYDDFVAATQGEMPPTTPKVAQAVKEWQAVSPEIRQRAIDAGIEVGDLGPTYYPHIIDYDKVFKDKNTYNQAINHLVQSGQAKSPEEAISLLSRARDISRNRQYGNLESSRIVDLPMYDRTPNSLIGYIQGTSRRISQAETFGKQDEIALDLINKAGLKGYDAEAMKNAYDVAVGAKNYNPNTSRFSGALRAYNSTTRLGTGALTNASQSVNTGIVTGHLRTLGSMLGQLDKKNRAFVEKTGVISDAVLNDLKTEIGFVGKTLGKITAPGFNQVEKFNRSVAAVAGKRYADNLASKGRVEALRKLGVTGKIGKELTESQQIQAARKIVEKTQFKVDPQDLPGWADSPLGKIVAQFRTFSYSQSKFFSNEVLKPLSKGNVMPLARLAAALPVGYALAETKRRIANRPEEDNKLRKGVEAFGNIGGAGLAVDMFRSMVPLNNKYLPADRRVSMAVSTFGGPSAGLGAELVGAVSEVAQPKNKPEDGLPTNKLPINVGDSKYLDATQLARFGLRQVPVVGTRLQNTLLPYKEKATKDQQEVLSSLTGDKKSEYEKALRDGRVTPEGQIKAPTIPKSKAGNASMGEVKELADGRFYTKVGQSNKTFDSKQEAEQAAAKEVFKKSEDKTTIIGDTYFYKTKQGDVKSKPKLQHEYDKTASTRKLKLDGAYERNDLDGYVKLADEEINALENLKQLYDPETEYENIDSITAKQISLLEKAETYIARGYTKKSSGKGKKSNGIAAAVSAIKNAPSVPKTGQVNNTSSRPTGARLSPVQLKKYSGGTGKLQNIAISSRRGIA